MKNKNKAYKEKQRKSAAIKAGTYVPPIPDHLIEGVMREVNMSKEAATQFVGEMLKIRTLAVPYGDKCCCRNCGRQNYPEYKGTQKMEWSPERSLFIVDPQLQEEARRETAIVLCEDCLKEEIEKQYHANGTYATYNDGTCTESLEGQKMSVVDFNVRTALRYWLRMKFNKDEVYHTLKCQRDVIDWLSVLLNSMVIKVAGEEYNLAQCYDVAAEFLLDLAYGVLTEEQRYFPAT